MASSQVRWCRVCQKPREPLAGGHRCNSCGTPTTEMRPPAVVVNVAPKCPQCRCLGREQPDGRYLCTKCSAWYERDDFGYVDDRPDVNAMKQEEHAARCAAVRKLNRTRRQ